MKIKWQSFIHVDIFLTDGTDMIYICIPDFPYRGEQKSQQEKRSVTSMHDFKTNMIFETSFELKNFLV